jgi:ribosome biogenesis protein UTP30
MLEDGLIESRISLHQCARAIEALHNHQSKEEAKRQDNELLPGKEQYIWLVLAVKRTHPEKKFKPFKMCAFSLFAEHL